MEDSDATAFIAALKMVEHVCQDTMDKARQTAYWMSLAPLCTIEEFELACLDVLAQMTERWMPMPGVFLKAIETRREMDTWRDKPKALPEPRDDNAMRECMQSLDKILGAHWREMADVLSARGRSVRHNQRADVPPPAATEEV